MTTIAITPREPFSLAASGRFLHIMITMATWAVVMPTAARVPW
ncbi:MAG: hypothetical protein ACLP7J_00795 [Streptosporangiaceae bacterium]